MTVSTYITAKASRLLSTGCVQVMRLDPDRVVAHVHGDTGAWVVRWEPDDGWTCNCPARRFCSHLAATELVTTRRQAPALRAVK